MLWLQAVLQTINTLGMFAAVLVVAILALGKSQWTICDSTAVMIDPHTVLGYALYIHLLSICAVVLCPWLCKYTLVHVYWGIMSVSLVYTLRRAFLGSHCPDTLPGYDVLLYTGLVATFAMNRVSSLPIAKTAHTD